MFGGGLLLDFRDIWRVDDYMQIGWGPGMILGVLDFRVGYPEECWPLDHDLRAWSHLMWPAGASGALYWIRGTGRSFRGGPVKCCARGTVLDSGELVGFWILERDAGDHKIWSSWTWWCMWYGHCIGFCMIVCDTDMTSWTLCINTWVWHLGYGMATEYGYGSEGLTSELGTV